MKYCLIKKRDIYCNDYSCKHKRKCQEVNDEIEQKRNDYSSTSDMNNFINTLIAAEVINDVLDSFSNDSSSSFDNSSSFDSSSFESGGGDFGGGGSSGDW